MVLRAMIAPLLGTAPATQEHTKGARDNQLRLPRAGEVSTRLCDVDFSGNQYTQHQGVVVFGYLPAQLNCDHPHVFGTFDDHRLGILVSLVLLSLGESG